MRGRRALLVVVAVLAAMLAPARRATADIYTWTDDDGVIHFTNIKPRGGKGWKRVVVENPDAGTKASAHRGACNGCDVVSARDTSPERFSRYDDYIHEAADLYRIPVPLIRAVIRVESDYDPRVVSSAGARGLMQLMPSVESDARLTDVFEPRQNILGGTRLLRILANHFDGDLVLTIAAYHAGAGAVAKYGNQVPPYAATRQYLKMVLDRYYQYKAKEERAR